jgi:hypothetical protein
MDEHEEQLLAQAPVIGRIQLGPDSIKALTGVAETQEEREAIWRLKIGFASWADVRLLDDAAKRAGLPWEAMFA